LDELLGAAEGHEEVVVVGRDDHRAGVQARNSAIPAAGRYLAAGDAGQEYVDRIVGELAVVEVGARCFECRLGMKVTANGPSSYSWCGWTSTTRSPSP
jgi:hypothetical protein